MRSDDLPLKNIFYWLWPTGIEPGQTLRGLRESLQRPNLLTTSYRYDNLGRIERIIHEDSLGHILERFDYI